MRGVRIIEGVRRGARGVADVTVAARRDAGRAADHFFASGWFRSRTLLLFVLAALAIPSLGLTLAALESTAPPPPERAAIGPDDPLESFDATESVAATPPSGKPPRTGSKAQSDPKKSVRRPQGAPADAGAAPAVRSRASGSGGGTTSAVGGGTSGASAAGGQSAAASASSGGGATASPPSAGDPPAPTKPPPPPASAPSQPVAPPAPAPGDEEEEEDEDEDDGASGGTKGGNKGGKKDGD